MIMLQYNYQVVNVEAISDSDIGMHVFMVNLYKPYNWCDSNYFEWEIYPPWNHVAL